MFGETRLLVDKFCLGVECFALSKSSCALFTILSLISVLLLRIRFDFSTVRWLLWFDFVWTLVVIGVAGTVKCEFVEDRDAWIEFWLLLICDAALPESVVLTVWTTLLVIEMLLLVAVLWFAAGDSASSVIVLAKKIWKILRTNLNLMS